MNRSLRAVLLSLVTALLSASLALPASATTVPVIEFNACGQVTNNPACPAHGSSVSTPGSLVDAIAQSVVSRCNAGNCPMLVLLNEVCRGQVIALLSRLSALGWSYAAGDLHVTASDSGLSCDPVNGLKEFGNGAVWRGTNASSAARKLYTNPPTGRRQGITCLATQTVINPQAQRICNTHLSPTASHRTGQSSEMRAFVNTYHNANVDTLLAGDMNELPASTNLDSIYRSAYGGGAFGNFNEVGANSGGTWTCCTRTGSATIDSSSSKLDYIFTGTGDWTPVSVSVSSSAVSDHKVLVSYVDY